MDHYSERSQALHLNIQAFSSFSRYLVDTNQVQSIQFRVSMNTVNNGKETLSKRQQSFMWGGVNLTAEVPEMLLLTMGCFTCEGGDGPAGYCATS